MQLILSNQIIIKNIDVYLQQVIVKELVHPNPKYEEALANGYSTRNIDPNIYNFSINSDNSYMVPRGYLSRLITLITSMGIPYDLVDNRTKNEYIAIDASNISYRKSQVPAINSFVLHNEGVLVAPPGSGKTVMGLSLISVFGQKTLWLTHTDRLFKQAEERAKHFLSNIGKVGTIVGKKWKLGDILTIGMVQTLNRNPDKVAEIRDSFGMVILDEAHHCPADTFMSTIKQLNPYYLYGLTATPNRRDRLERLLFQVLGPINARITMQELVANGDIIVPVVKYRSIDGPPIDGNNTGKLIKDHLIYNDKRNGTIVGDVLREAAQDNYCIVITDIKNHAETLYALIKAGWDKTGIATGDYSKKEIDALVKQFENKEINVLVTTFALLGEGFDVNFLNRAFIALPFRAENKAEQLIGRIQRCADNKKDAIVYEYIDVNIGVFRHQFYSGNKPNSKDCRYKCYERLGVRVEPY